MLLAKTCAKGGATGPSHKGDPTPACARARGGEKWSPCQNDGSAFQWRRSKILAAPGRRIAALKGRICNSNIM